MNKKATLRNKRKLRIRKHVSGTSTRPRLTVYRSNQHISVQAIDDVANKTLCATSDVLCKVSNNVEGAASVGEELGKKLKALKIESAVFDRNGYRYHGRVKSLADGIRKSGILF